MAIDNTPMLVPHLVVDDAAAALDFYAKAFGGEEMVRIPGPDADADQTTAPWRFHSPALANAHSSRGTSRRSRRGPA